MSSLFSSVWRGNSQLKFCSTSLKNVIGIITVRNKCKDVELPSNSGPKSGAFRRIVHYPEKYTVQPLKITRLGGRDPVSGRVVVNGIGGGIKRKYHWVEWKREAPKDGPPVEEKIIDIIVDWCRTSRIALVAGGNKMKYYLATENMKPGDIITTSSQIPRIPVLAKEGNAHPLGALPNGTLVNNVEKYPGKGGWYIHAAGSSGTVLRKVNDLVVVQLPSKHEIALPQECMATVGKCSFIQQLLISNIIKYISDKHFLTTKREKELFEKYKMDVNIEVKGVVVLNNGRCSVYNRLISEAVREDGRSR